jgi:putative transcriptional regulator
MNYNGMKWQSGRMIKRPRNPMTDPLAAYKRPLTGPDRGKAVVEFEPLDVRHIRGKFGATQREFAALIGISWETLRNWEEGRRRPHGPARALLRAIDADPVVLARVLNWHADEAGPEPDEWIDD